MRLRHHNDAVRLNIEAEHRMAPVAALGIHQNGFAQEPSDRRQKTAEHLEPLLPLELPQIDIEVDLIRRVEPEDRQDIHRRPNPQFRALGASRAGKHARRRGQRQHCRAFGVLERPFLSNDEIEDRLPVFQRGARYADVRHRPHHLGIEEPPDVIPQQIRHHAILPSPQS
ncbi:hypothetical protein ACGF3C_10885 [Micromonospora sp. NPDC047762]|uniref:hypothetical protein n=1 Tax=Micromonospora sp. NPDC047762 TaxID=3364255 RepID=UPI00371437C6